ncbi:MAG: tyrosine--tRNA ligase [Candidatus Levybacteria bacterium RIFCSPLOWO2_01_FULL_39_24]|nr:MAG: tyrosine--tRNA ligase [Candidatus Levybacteria bacterium RIFCSPHIGHO2_01_FULL_40_16]OGH28247.1 MAG: tyrosine--tRNA ligase [Candidatus Levybacteria bacterium RIFCSPHIGHO2_12_FULL_39_9]OGH46522.1 MAG: tyrosine--tRNA ligase [Candidatus Levybacteria bacterium RIFCSPLOWO2_01_FULL_39_24]
MDKIQELLTRGVANIIPNKEELKKLLASGKKLNVYLGIDPTTTKIHLGHAVVLRKLNEFAKLGHSVTFLIGDFTALIGDTSDKDTERPVLTPIEIQENFKTYKKQAEKILDFSKIKVRNNSEWLDKLNLRKVIELCQKFSLNDFVSRELMKKRFNQRSRIALHEVLYPAIQGYDSYFLDTDIQIGGTDQTFNMQAGRILQKNWKNKESFIIATEFLMGTDGRKMSKSWGNAIWLDDTPSDMFAKIMAINDDLIDQYFTLATNKSFDDIKKIKSGKGPMEIKKELTKIIVTELHGEKDALNARENFEKTVQGKEKPTDMATRTIANPKAPLAEILVETGLAKSKSEGKRVIEQSGTTVDGKKITDPSIPFNSIASSGATIQVGPIRFVKTEWKK